jgi:CRISPR-associated endonuclease/helicase Cas3
MRSLDLGKYRHEFGSLLDLVEKPEFAVLSSEDRELLLHLVAAHHGRARPHFSMQEAFDPGAGKTEVMSHDLAKQVPRRFAQLQRKYGRWGLAYLESILRAADALASMPEEENGHANH